MREKKTLTLGSLFDGSGGFPLGGLLSGITPVWASEIEPFAVRVTTKRLPQVKHYGDVSAVSGAELEPVDIITFGSPCQDMSIAGKRSGLDGSRSSLFYEAIRIVKEMREKTNGEKPRFIVWENVPGAFSSNKGADFKAVLEEVIHIKDEEASVPAPDKKGWPDADYYVGDGWSVAYRVLDAQWWGVPQRRKRIYLVGDLAGGCAPEVLFESEGLSGYSAESFRTWQRTAARLESGIGETGCAGFDGYNGQLTGCVSSTLGENCGMSTGRNGVIVLNDQGGERMDVTHDMTTTLRAEAHHPPCVVEAAGFCTEHSAQARSIGYEEEKSPTLRAGVVPAALAIENHPTDSRVKICEDGKVQTLTSRMGTGGNNVPLVMAQDVDNSVDNSVDNIERDGDNFGECGENPVPITMKIRSGCDGGGKGALWQVDQSATLGCNNDQTLFVPICMGNGQANQSISENVSGTLDDIKSRQIVAVPTAFGICSKDSNAMKSDNPHSGFYEATTSRTLDRSGGTPCCNQGGIAVVEQMAFAQNQRDEVRDLGDVSGALAAEPGMKQQTFVLQGSMIGRSDANGPQGDGVNEDVSFTLNTIDRHAVCQPAYGIDRAAFNQGQNAQFGFQIEEEISPTMVARGPNAVASPVYAMTTGSFQTVAEDVAPTLMARDFKDPTTIGPVPHLNEGVMGTVATGAHPSGFNGQDAYNDRLVIDNPEIQPEVQYTVRRLTPTECARLQGFPDWWCQNLGTEDPTEEELAFWAEVFETHRKLMGKSTKPKTEKQLRKWLADPYSDAAEYKLWGNGISLPIVFFVLSGIKWAYNKDLRQKMSQ